MKRHPLGMVGQRQNHKVTGKRSHERKKKEERLFEEREHLSSSMELIPHQTCAFANAKILKFIPKLPVKVYLEMRAEEKVTEIKNYDTSPGVIFPMVSHKETTVMGDMASAQLFVKHLGLWLKQCKANRNSNTNKAQMDEHGKSQVKKHWVRELQLNIGEMVALIKQSKSVAFETCLMMAHSMSSCVETSEIIEWLQERRSLFQCIEELMTQLSASERAVMQPNYSRLCEDAAILTNNILGWMKIIKETFGYDILEATILLELVFQGDLQESFLHRFIVAKGYLSQKFDPNDSFFGASHLISESKAAKKKKTPNA
ncbi:unnamed protein product [Lactuca saligna]|uniref:Uncharacterized protein n=1 Tax=Lactuca saligna TaxID=75948 RepID=A0AA35YM48_LACSI|nr:unnamed protein product [Lactuca saligna]